MLPQNFKEILKNGLSLDHIYILYLIEFDYEGLKLIGDDTKVKALYKGLVRHNYAFTEGNIVHCTTSGKELAKMWSVESINPITVIDKTGDFDKWWDTYPGTDTFTYQNKTFRGSRALRMKKEECRLKFEQVIMQGTFTADQMIKALEIEVEQKKAASLKTGVNKLSYMQNSLTYLNQRTFEPYIDLIGNKQIKKPTEVSI